MSLSPLSRLRNSASAPTAKAAGAASVLAATLLLSGCSTLGGDAADEPTSDAAFASTAAKKGANADKGDGASDSAAQPAADVLPADTFPEKQADGECPYLDSQWVAETNGQRITYQGVDNRFDTPACLIWSYPEEPQAVVLVREMPDEDAAIEVVDWAAPIKQTEPAEEPAGWSGGRGVIDERAVYAVQKGNVAVAVWSNQLQTVKAELIAKEAIKNLEL